MKLTSGFTPGPKMKCWQKNTAFLLTRSRDGRRQIMDELERRALLGDSESQEECTRRGILLPCPFCGNENIRISNWGMWRCWCPECFGKSEDCLRERDAIKHWNTRQAPPLGRCDQCKNWRGEPGDKYAPCKDCDGVTDCDGYCRNFEPREDANE